MCVEEMAVEERLSEHPSGKLEVSEVFLVDG